MHHRARLSNLAWLTRRSAATFLLVIALLELPLPGHGWGQESVTGNGPFAVPTRLTE